MPINYKALAEDLLYWPKILDDNPEAKPGFFNPRRLELLAPGVYQYLNPVTAGAWLTEFAELRESQGLPTSLCSEDPDEDPVRVTILEVLEGADKILVEIEGVKGRIYASCFAHCIKGEDQCPATIKGLGSGWAVKGSEPGWRHGGNVG